MSEVVKLSVERPELARYAHWPPDLTARMLELWEHSNFDARMIGLVIGLPAEYAARMVRTKIWRLRRKGAGVLRRVA